MSQKQKLPRICKLLSYMKINYSLLFAKIPSLFNELKLLESFFYFFLAILIKYCSCIYGFLVINYLHI